MKLEIFTLCDHAADYGGKACITGAFDHIRAKSAPQILPTCAVFARVRFNPIEEGTHSVRISFVDEDGGRVVPPLDGRLSVRFGERTRTKSIDFVMRIQNLKLPTFGEYRVDFAVGGTQLGSLPLYFDPSEP